MAVPESTLWDRDPHTEAKHRVLAGYYDAWYPIMLRQWPGLTVFEGYAGPGEHTQGQEGSPVIALRKLLNRPELLSLGKPVRFVFVEERRDRFEHLRDLIAQKFPVLPRQVNVEYVHGSCEDVWQESLDAAHAWGQPIFANLDPFGAGVPCELVAELGRNRGSEVLVTFMSDWLRRFATLDHLDDGDRQFGSKQWRNVVNLEDPETKEMYLVSEYRETLVRAGLSLTARFKLSDEGGRAFHLTYGTGHRTGLERMKAAMWKVDPVLGMHFRDPKDPNQGILDLGASSPNLAPLIRQLLAHVKRGPFQGLTLGDLREYGLFETGFRPPHVTVAVRLMLSRNQLGRDPESGRLSNEVRLFKL